ncbi:hypothetical protein [Pilimelia columellifera]|uniref:Secreted protein n=1 Tax=Pilimelia columellifera subsp. columellifera TaxID=706583 RepID=A0ABN3MXF2_9ACTN
MKLSRWLGAALIGAGVLVAPLSANAAPQSGAAPARVMLFAFDSYDDAETVGEEGEDAGYWWNYWIDSDRGSYSLYIKYHKRYTSRPGTVLYTASDVGQCNDLGGQGIKHRVWAGFTCGGDAGRGTLTAK